MERQGRQHPDRGAEHLHRRAAVSARAGDVALSDAPDRATRTPFPGLQPFGDSDEDAALFAGRDADIALVASNVRAARLTILYGPSGVGKSSLLQAGVVRRLRERSDAEHDAIVLHGEWAGDPGAALARRIELAAGGGAEAPALDEAIEHFNDRRRGKLLLILDQFEEYLRLHPVPGEDSLDELLPEIVERRDLRVHVLISLRDDALSELDRFEGRMPSLFENYLRLAQLTPAAARDAIEKPIARVNGWRAHAGVATVQIEEGLVGDVLGQLADPRLSSIDPHAGGAPEVRAEAVEPAFLQLVMRRLWDSDAGRDPPILRRGTLSDIGGATAIVRGHLDGAMASLTPAQRDVAAAIFGYLVTPSGAKIRYTVEDLASPDYADRPAADVAAVLNALSSGERRIIRRVPAPSGDPDGQGFEIFHDVLAGAVRGWTTRVRAAHAERMERRNVRLATAVAALLAITTGLLAYTASPAFVKKLELATVDIRYGLRGGHDPDPKIAIVGDDARSAAITITRSEQAKVLDAVAAGHPAVIVEAFEFEFAAERGELPATLQLQSAVRRADPLLATNRIDENGNTTLFGWLRHKRRFSGAQVAYAAVPLDADCEVPPDADCEVRRVLYEGRLTQGDGTPAKDGLFTLATMAVRRAGDRVDENDFALRIRDEPSAWIDFAGGPGTYPSASFVDVLRSRVDPRTFRDRIVIIGDLSTGGADDGSYLTAADGSTPMSSAEILANAIATVRAGIPLSGVSSALTIALIVAFGLLASLLAIRLSKALTLAISAGAGLLFVLAAQLSFDAGTILELVPPLIALAVAAVAVPVVARIARIGGRSRSA